jgi:hypothetical protein
MRPPTRRSPAPSPIELGRGAARQIRPDFAAAGGDVGGNTFWIDPGTHMMEVNGEFRSSIITTPNGLPPARKPTAGPSRLPRDARKL